MTTLDEFTAETVREGRCLSAPVGCGKPVFGADGKMLGDIDHTDPNDEADYIAEWKATGLCADCQDEQEELEDRRVDRSTWAADAYEVLLGVWEELVDREREILNGEAGEK